MATSVAGDISIKAHNSLNIPFTIKTGTSGNFSGTLTQTRPLGVAHLFSGGGRIVIVNSGTYKIRSIIKVSDYNSGNVSSGNAKVLVKRKKASDGSNQSLHTGSTISSNTTVASVTASATVEAGDEIFIEVLCTNFTGKVRAFADLGIDTNTAYLNRLNFTEQGGVKVPISGALDTNTATLLTSLGNIIDIIPAEDGMDSEDVKRFAIGETTKLVFLKNRFNLGMLCNGIFALHSDSIPNVVGSTGFTVINSGFFGTDTALGRQAGTMNRQTFNIQDTGEELEATFDRPTIFILDVSGVGGQDLWDKSFISDPPRTSLPRQFGAGSSRIADLIQGEAFASAEISGNLEKIIETRFSSD